MNCPDPHALVPAAVSYLADGTAFSEAYGDVYHSAAGAIGQARHVFLSGNGLPARWAGRPRFTIVETGFGTGLNFLATWLAWRRSRTDRARLHFVSLEMHPLQRDDLQRALARHLCATPAAATAFATGQAPDPDADDRAALAPLVDALVDAWPTILTSGMHRLTFDDDRVVLTLAFGDAYATATQLRLRADAFYLDGFSPACNPAMWQPRLFKALARLADESATLTSYTSAGQVRRDLVDAGFAVKRVPGFGGKRHMTAGPFAPRWRVRRHPPLVPALASSLAAGDTAAGAPAAVLRTALVIGAGVAGCAMADQLIRRGWQVVLLEAGAHAGAGASGNPAGLFHPVVTRDEGRATRWSRAAFLHALRYWRRLDRQRAASMTPLRWSDHGLIQRIASAEPSSNAPAATTDPATLQPAEEEANDLPHAPGLPLSIAERVALASVRSDTGVDGSGDAWRFAEGGWIDPRSLIDHMLSRARRGRDAQYDLRIRTRVARLVRDADGWRALDANDALIARSDIVVMANANDAGRLAGVDFLPTEPVRGQLTLIPLPPTTAGAHGQQRADVAARALRMPLIDGAYAIPLPGSLPLRGLQRRDEDGDGNPPSLPASLFPAGHPAQEPDKTPETHETAEIAPPAWSGNGTGAYLLTGASYEVGVDTTAISEREHVENLARLTTLLAPDIERGCTDGSIAPGCGNADDRLTGRVDAADHAATPAFDAPLLGRAAVRCVTSDRMPFVGQIPDTSQALAKANALRGAHLADLPRTPGLFGIFGLGSRGILWSALAAECLASLIDGEPAPIETDLLDAMDPARFLLRHLRRGPQDDAKSAEKSF